MGNHRILAYHQPAYDKVNQQSNNSLGLNSCHAKFEFRRVHCQMLWHWGMNLRYKARSDCQCCAMYMFRLAILYYTGVISLHISCS